MGMKIKEKTCGTASNLTTYHQTSPSLAKGKMTMMTRSALIRPLDKANTEVLTIVMFGVIHLAGNRYRCSLVSRMFIPCSFTGSMLIAFLLT